MAVIKCKMCGGDLNLVEDTSTAECEYCGSVQTVPKVDDDKKLTLFARANRLRFACEFDKAAGVYENIVADFPEEAEAYWGLVLCKYGIEYVDDPATGKKIPTCHRSSFDSVMEDSDFEQVLENADGVARRVYREEAKAIEELRKGIIAVSANEQPYDIFICYKETAEDGDRTLDSVLAQDVYDALTDKGYRVFFSRISLEDKLGVEYEPYIFAALNSAKIMLAFGTDYEYFNAVWVKNEWSRFLKLMAKDKEKHLIPCYKGIDAYDMPKEFAKLQAQDMGKVGAIQDLLRGIEKLMPRQAEIRKETLVQERILVGSTGDSKIASLLDRGNMALEDGDWEKADSFFEDVLNNDSKNAQAYLGKVLAQEQCRTMDAFIRKRKETTQKVSAEQLHLHARTEYIRKMAEKFAVPGYLAANEISALYDFNLSYPSDVGNRMRQYRDEEKYWAEHKLLARAEKFAFGPVAEGLAAEKKALLDALMERVHAAEKTRDVAKAQTEALYAQHIQKADQQAEAKYQEASQRRETDYVQLIEIAQTSVDLQVLKKTESKLRVMGGYRESEKYADMCVANYEKAYALFAEKRKVAAFVKSRISVSPNVEYPLHMGINTDGQVVLSGVDKYRDNARSWSDMAAISMGEYHVMGLTRFGTVRAVGDNQYGQCDVSGWNNAVAVVAGGWHSVGLRADGTVCAVGLNDEGECNVSAWRDITKVVAGRRHTVGLKKDGTVVATGLANGGRLQVSKWTNVVDVFAFNGQTAAVKADGTVVVAGARYRVDHWRDIVTVSMGYENILGLKKDGTVVYAGESHSNEHAVDGWTDIVDIHAKNCHCVGLRADGTVVAAGLEVSGQCAVKSWRNIVAISISDFCTLGIQADGTVLRAGDCQKQPYTAVRFWKLFDNVKTLEAELDAGMKKTMLRKERREQGRCQYCGGQLKGLFVKKCVVCGKDKDY